MLAAEPIRLPLFSDADLGPDGPFVTRWGLDPIRGGPQEQVGAFIPHTAFLNWPGNPNGASFVPNVAIPLADLHPRQESGAAPAPKPDEVETFSAGLLTFAPRFDVESEKWFVDLKMKPQRMMTPFLRLGLVRHQEHAAPGLRVSAPVAVWTQIQPPREVTVRAEPLAKEKQVRINVEIDADAAAHADRRIEVSVLECGFSEAGRRYERTVKEPATLIVSAQPDLPLRQRGRPPASTPGRGAKRQLSGRFAVELPAITLHFTDKDRDPRRYAVVVEETEDMPSTADVPAHRLPPATAEASSGPRFLARLEISV